TQPAPVVEHRTRLAGPVSQAASRDGSPLINSVTGRHDAMLQASARSFVERGVMASCDASYCVFTQVLFSLRTSGKFSAGSISTLTRSDATGRSYTYCFPRYQISTGSRTSSVLPSAKLSRRSTGIGRPPGLEMKIALVVPDESVRDRKS